MKKNFCLLLVALLIQVGLFAQNLPYLKSSTFEEGEVLNYKLKYGFLTAAEASLRVVETDVKFDKNPTYHLVAQGRTSGSFDVFYKVRNRYDSYIDKKDFTPYLYTENIQEDRYRRTDKARFYQEEKKVVASKGTFRSSVSQTFDLISAYYFARNIDFSDVKKGDKLTLRYFLDDNVTPLTIEYLGKEMVKTNNGKVRCLKFSPSISPGRIFKKDSQLFLWITDDANRIPVKAQAEVLVGNITMELVDAKGLRYPFQASK